MENDDHNGNADANDTNPENNDANDDGGYQTNFNYWEWRDPITFQIWRRHNQYQWWRYDEDGDYWVLWDSWWSSRW